MTVEYVIYILKDSKGNEAYAVCEEPADTVQVCGLKKPDGSNAYFESDAYHLGSFCQENEIELKRIDKSETLTF